MKATVELAVVLSKDPDRQEIKKVSLVWKDCSVYWDGIRATTEANSRTKGHAADANLKLLRAFAAFKVGITDDCTYLVEIWKRLEHPESGNKNIRKVFGSESNKPARFRELFASNGHVLRFNRDVISPEDVRIQFDLDGNSIEASSELLRALYQNIEPVHGSFEPFQIPSDAFDVSHPQSQMEHDDLSHSSTSTQRANDPAEFVSRSWNQDDQVLQEIDPTHPPVPRCSANALSGSTRQRKTIRMAGLISSGLLMGSIVLAAFAFRNRNDIRSLDVPGPVQRLMLDVDLFPFDISSRLLADSDARDFFRLMSNEQRPYGLNADELKSVRESLKRDSVRGTACYYSAVIDPARFGNTRLKIALKDSLDGHWIWCTISQDSAPERVAGVSLSSRVVTLFLTHQTEIVLVHLPASEAEIRSLMLRVSAE